MLKSYIFQLFYFRYNLVQYKRQLDIEWIMKSKVWDCKLRCKFNVSRKNGFIVQSQTITHKQQGLHFNLQPGKRSCSLWFTFAGLHFNLHSGLLLKKRWSRFIIEPKSRFVTKKVYYYTYKQVGSILNLKACWKGRSLKTYTKV